MGLEEQRLRIRGTSAAELAYAAVELPSGIGGIWAYVSVVDGVTGDATTDPALHEKAAA